MTFSPTNVLITGAGFSFNAGLPLASDFTAELLNLTRPSRPEAAILAN